MVLYDGLVITRGAGGVTKVPRQGPSTRDNNYEKWRKLRNEALHQESEAQHIEAKAKNEDELFKLASQYQSQTIGTLNHVMAAKLGELRFEEAEPSRLRWQMSLFNVWPLNLICKMPVEK